MPIRRVKQFKSWSFSRLNDWEVCPLRARKKYLEKFEEPEGPAFTRGKKIEVEINKYLFTQKSKVMKCPDSGARFIDELNALRSISKSVICNKDLAFDRDWKPCPWDAWDRAWVRIRMDLLWASSPEDPFVLPRKVKQAVARVVDLKTGKIYEDKIDQVDLYKLCALLIEPGLLPTVVAATSQLWYLDEGETRPDGSWSSLLPADVEKAKRYWEKRVRPMLLDEAFLPRPSNRCRWCPHAKEKGGPCPY
jgi:hypothetical protein